MPAVCLFRHQSGSAGQALPEPGVRVVAPFSGVAVSGQEADGPQRRLTITRREHRLLARYDAVVGVPVDGRLRRPAARTTPAPIRDRSTAG